VQRAVAKVKGNITADALPEFAGIRLTNTAAKVAALAAAERMPVSKEEEE
jgi:hypothetical protein